MRRRFLIAFVVCGALAVAVGVAAHGGPGLLTKRSQIYVLQVKSGKLRRFTNGAHPSFGPAWSPDGRRLAYVSGNALVTSTTAGNTLTSTTSSGGFFLDSAAWSRDGRLAATAVSGRRLGATVLVLSPTGSHVVARTRAGTADSSRGPTWSPDGTRLAFCLQGPNTPAQGGVSASGELDIAVARADGSGKRVLTTAPGSEVDPSWSPDGRWILYDGEAPNEPGSSGAALRLVPSTGGRSRLVVRLSTLWGASWSPDGKLIAFAGNAVGEQRTHLYVVRPDGTGLSRLTGEITPARPVWSPDGKLIAFGTYAADIEAIAPDGTGIKTLVRLGGAQINDLAWSPDGSALAFDAAKQPPES